jgi:hypothetical protein
MDMGAREGPAGLSTGLTKYLHIQADIIATLATLLSDFGRLES